MNDNLFCENCEYVFPKEQEQKLSDHRHHRCLKYDQFLFHNSFHPKIVKCDECKLSRKIERYDFISNL